MKEQLTKSELKQLLGKDRFSFNRGDLTEVKNAKENDEDSKPKGSKE
jgi:hypothetical protein